VPVFPHDFIKTNTIFEIVRAPAARPPGRQASGLRLGERPSGKAWSISTRPKSPTSAASTATASVVCTVKNDQKKVAASSIRSTAGNHDGTMSRHPHRVRYEFSSRQRWPEAGQGQFRRQLRRGHRPTPRRTAGGYKDGSGTPTDVLGYALKRRPVAAKHDRALSTRNLRSTLFIVSSKHGQSPINPLKVNKPATSAPRRRAAGRRQRSGSPGDRQRRELHDWTVRLRDGRRRGSDLATGPESDGSGRVVFERERQGSLYRRGHGGRELRLKFNNPNKDNRTPDIIVQPVYGTIYTTRRKKIPNTVAFSFATPMLALSSQVPLARTNVKIAGGNLAGGGLPSCARWDSIQEH